MKLTKLIYIIVFIFYLLPIVFSQTETTNRDHILNESCASILEINRKTIEDLTHKYESCENQLNEKQRKIEFLTNSLSACKLGRALLN